MGKEPIYIYMSGAPRMDPLGLKDVKPACNVQRGSEACSAERTYTLLQRRSRAVQWPWHGAQSYPWNMPSVDERGSIKVVALRLTVILKNVLIAEERKLSTLERATLYIHVGHRGHCGQVGQDPWHGPSGPVVPLGPLA